MVTFTASLNTSFCDVSKALFSVLYFLRCILPLLVLLFHLLPLTNAFTRMTRNFSSRAAAVFYNRFPFGWLLIS